MSKDAPPAFLFYPREFVSDPNVIVMSCEEVGAYLFLLCAAWTQREPGTLPNDDRLLARLSRLGDRRWKACREHLLAAFTVTPERLIQRRMVQERTCQMLRSAQQSNAAKLRWNKETVDASASVTHMHNDGLPLPLQLPLPKDSIAASPLTPFERFWDAWPVGHRVGKAAAEKAYNRACRRAAAGCIMAGVERAKQSEQWLKDGGRFIPHPSTWLNQGRWDDDTPAATTKGAAAVLAFTTEESTHE